MQVPVHVLRDPLTDDGRRTRTTVTLTAKSETDPTKTATQTCAVHVKRHDPRTRPTWPGRGRRGSAPGRLRCSDGAPPPASCSRWSRSPAAAATTRSRAAPAICPAPCPRACASPRRRRARSVRPTSRPSCSTAQPVTASDLWRDRPFVLVFTASYCDRCEEIHRAAAEAVDCARRRDRPARHRRRGRRRRRSATTPTSSTSATRSPWRASGRGSTTPPASRAWSSSSRRAGRCCAAGPAARPPSSFGPRLEELFAR